MVRFSSTSPQLKYVKQPQAVTFVCLSLAPCLLFPFILWLRKSRTVDPFSICLFACYMFTMSEHIRSGKWLPFLTPCEKRTLTLTMRKRLTDRAAAQNVFGWIRYFLNETVQWASGWQCGHTARRSWVWTPSAEGRIHFSTTACWDRLKPPTALHRISPLEFSNSICVKLNSFFYALTLFWLVTSKPILSPLNTKKIGLDCMAGCACCF